MKVEQKAVIYSDSDSSKYNFLKYTGSYNGIDSHLRDGWYVKFISENGDSVFVLYEKQIETETGDILVRRLTGL